MFSRVRPVRNPFECGRVDSIQDSSESDLAGPATKFGRIQLSRLQPKFDSI